MDGQQFDRLVAAAARRRDRRSALGLLGGSLIGSLLALRRLDAARASRPDSDGDGLYDDDETDVYGTDPFNPDSDGDGQDDGAEVYYGTDPLDGGGGGGGGVAAPGGGGDAPGGVNQRPDSGVCAPGLTLCSGFCVDLTSDFYNCGLCNNPCFGRDDPRTYCENNFCVYPCIAEGTC